MLKNHSYLYMYASDFIAVALLGYLPLRSPSECLAQIYYFDSAHAAYFASLRVGIHKRCL